MDKYNHLYYYKKLLLKNKLQNYTPRFTINLILYFQTFAMQTIIIFMYSQLKSRIEEEKRRAENNLKNLTEIKNSPKRYVVYEENKSSNQSQGSPIILKQTNQFSPNGEASKINDHSILHQLKQITQLKREEKIAKFSVQIEHLSKQNGRLQSQVADLKANISQKYQQMVAIENKYKEGLCIYLEKCSKLQQEEANYKDIIRQFRTNIQVKDQSITKLQKQLYELEHSLQLEKQEKLKLKQGGKIIKMEKEQIINSFKMLHQSILSFFNQYETFVFSNFRKQSHEDHNGEFQSQYFDLQEISQKFKIIHENHLNSDLENSNLKIEIKKLNENLENTDKKNSILQQELKEVYIEVNSKVQAVQLLQKKTKEILVENEELSHRLARSDEQLNKSKVQLVQKSNFYQQTIESLKENLSTAEVQLIASRKMEVDNQQKLQLMSEQLQQMKIKKQYNMIVLQNRQKQLNTQVQNLKGQINSLIKQQQVNTERLKASESKNSKLNEEIQKLKDDLKKIGQQLNEEKTKEMNERQKGQRIEEQQHELRNNTQKQIQFQKSEVEKITKQLTECIREKQQLNLKNIELESKNRQLKQQILEKSEECIQIKKDKNTSEEKVKQLLVTFEEQQNKKSILQGELVSLKNQLQLSCKSLSYKQEEILSIKGQLQKLKKSTKNQKNEYQQRQLEFIHIEQIINQRVKQNHQQNQEVRVKQNETKGACQLATQQFCKTNKKNTFVDQDSQCQLVLVKQVLEKQVEIKENDDFNKIKLIRQEALGYNANEVNVQINLGGKQKVNQLINDRQNIQKTQENQELLIEIKKLQTQNVLFKNNYLKLQVQNLLNLSNLSISLSRINEKDYELNLILELGNKMKEQINQLGSEIIILTKKIKELQNGIAKEKNIDCEIQSNLTECITRIKHNCLKNNCDSVGIINIQFGKYTYDGPKNLHLTSSPTDLQKFNHKQDIRSLEELKLYYDGENQQKSKVRGPYSVLTLGQAAKNKNKVSQLKINEINMPNQFKPNENLARSLIKRVVSQEYTQQNKQSAGELKQERSQEAYSTQNNADTQQISLLPYPLLLQKYRNLKIDLQKMQEYICHVHSVNFKIKKSIAQIDHYAKFNAISKIQEKLQNLVNHNQTFLKNETQEFVTQILKILTELQSYIHFVDHLSKIEPFSESKYNNHRFFRMKRRVTTNAKLDKQYFNKKTYSQGQSRQDDLLQHFDTNLYEQQEEFIHNDIQGKQPEKKQKCDIERYFQQKKQLYSQISSVKNQSLRSQNSFMNSKSELWQLGVYLKNKLIQDTQQHEQSHNKKQSNDSQKLSQMSMKDIKKKYNKLKQQNGSLAKEKNHLQKVCKKLEQQQNDYKKKLAKMTKQFNDSFKLLCQISQNQRLNGLKVKNEQNQISIQTDKNYAQSKPKQNIIKPILHANGSSPVKSVPEIIQLQKNINEKNVKIKELQNFNQILKKDIIEGQKKNEEKIQQIRLNYLKQFDGRTKKINSDFASFLEKIIEKMPILKQLQKHKQVTPRKKSFFRKNSIKQIDVGFLQPQRIKPTEILDLIGKMMIIQDKAQLHENITLSKLESIMIQSLQRMIKKNNCEIFASAFQQIKKFVAMQSDEECFSELNTIRLVFDDYFQQRDKVSELFNIMVEIVSNLKRDSEVSISNLSINSQCDDVKKIQQKHFSQIPEESEDEKIKMIAQIQRDYQKIKKQNSQLLQQIKQIVLKVNEKDNFIQIQQQQLISIKEDNRIKFSEIEAENVYLKQQMAKLKQKPRKKTRIYHINQ